MSEMALAKTEGASTNDDLSSGGSYGIGKNAVFPGRGPGPRPGALAQQNGYVESFNGRLRD